MAFILDRIDAASRLWVSSRTIDRHIQAGRIKTRRIGKKIFLDDEDVEILRNMDPARSEDDYTILDDRTQDDDREILPPSQKPVMPHTNSLIDQSAVTELVRLYDETRGIIIKKDETIQDLSYKLWKAETDLKNMIPLVEYNKATFLLESAKAKHDMDGSSSREKIQTLEKEISKKNAAIISLALLFVLVLGFSLIFFLYTRLL